MEKNVCTVNFNTPELTRAAILSLWKHTPGCQVTVFDNSDRLPFGVMDDVRVIDNTRGQAIDFRAFLDQFPDKTDARNDWGSAKHCRTVQELFRFFPEGFVLMDSDVLVKRDISVFFNPECIFVGEEGVTPYRHRHKIPRLLPFLCWINVEMCRQQGISYFDPDRCWMLHPDSCIQSWYDTGASFLEDCRVSGAPAKSLRLDGYILHLKGASWTGGGFHSRVARNEPAFIRIGMDRNEYQIIIPYYAPGAQGNELAYAVAGWRKHFKEQFHITVVGDWHPVAETGPDISFIECPQVPDPGPENYRPHIDHVHKFRKALETMPGIDGFIYACDDMYAVNDFDIHDVCVLKKLSDSIRGNANSSNGWQRDAFRTQERLLSEGYPVVNYVCHLPVYYELDKLLAIWDRYDCDHVSYIVEDLYFNTWFCRRRALWVKAPSDPFKMGIYKMTPAPVIREAMDRKVWITNNPDGWSAGLAALLEEHYQFYL